MKKMDRKIVCILLAITLLSGVMGTAYATEYSSASKTVTVYGHEYEYWSSIDSQDKYNYVLYSVYGRAVGGTLQGYMGLRPRLYSEDGSLIDAADWDYNDKDYTSTTRLRVPWVYNDGVPGDYYYSRGQVKFYNGDGYTIYTCNASPNIRVPLTAKTIQVNADGKVYGPEIFLAQLGIEADLIQARGNSGNIGYVKSTDLNIDDDVETPSDAIYAMTNRGVDRMIPVYASDGETIIDTFTVYGGQALEVVDGLAG